ncbi:MAG: D-glycerate dehydrogenase [Cyanobacteria bacterium]|nr:D-glycerate dehydrogenase [Cyanobacteriota bacterium]
MSKLKVLVMGKMAQSAIDKLAENAEFEEIMRDDTLPQETLEKHLAGKFAIICEPLDKLSPELLDSCKDLRHISNRAVGFDNIDLAEATKRNILVTNTPGVLDNATADLAMALLLACTRRVVEADRYIRAGRWKGFGSSLMLGPDLYGKTIGIVGIGRIGTAFARRARVFGLEIVYTRQSPAGQVDHDLTKELGARRVEMEELLAVSDFISVHCPLNQSTRKLIGAHELSMMKPSCILINTARGAIIDQEALIDRLQQGKLAGAGLDVFEDEPNVPAALIEMENVVLTPHIASACVETRRMMAELAVNAVIDSYNRRRPVHLLNPQAWENHIPAVETKAGSNG